MNIKIIIIFVILFFLIIAFILFATLPALTPGKRTIVRRDMQNIITALIKYYADNRHYPTEEAGLDVIKKYLENIGKNDLKDPWGNNYIYIVPGPGDDSFEIISYGEDGKPGGKQDFSSFDF